MELITIGLVVLVAACLQGSIGFGLGMLAAPVIALVKPEVMPATLILLAAATSGYALLRERTAIDWSIFGWAFLGRLPGTAMGAAAVVLLPVPWLSLLVGLTVLFGVGCGLNGWSPKVTLGSKITAGGLSGLFGTATSIGGPPMAMIVRQLQPAGIRATLSAYFTLGSLVSLGALWIGGAMTTTHLRAALVFAPFMVAGLLLSNLTRRYLPVSRMYFIAATASVAGALFVTGQAIVTLVTG